jgi:hypothetical protein
VQCSAVQCSAVQFSEVYEKVFRSCEEGVRYREVDLEGEKEWRSRRKGGKHGTNSYLLWF